MTYTYKLARRLAISRNLAMLSALVLSIACMGETTGPEANSSSLPLTPTAFRVVPGAVTIETNQQIRFRGESETDDGAVYSSPLTWEATGGSIDPTGNFTATTPGTYKVVGRGRGRGLHRPDTSIVIVVPPLWDLVALEISPEAASVEARGTHQFRAIARMRNGTQAPIGVTWAASGGTIDPSGLYKAGATGGSFRVVATNTTGKLADTAVVAVASIEPGPLPTPEPEPTAPTPSPSPTPAPGAITRVVLTPAIATLATGSTKRFAAFGRNAAGDSVAVAVTFDATGGTITAGGLYTAGRTAGTYRIIARSSGLADTAEVKLNTVLGSPVAPPSGSPVPPGVVGIPMSMSGLLASGADPGPFSGSLDGYSAENIISRIVEARGKRMRIMLNMTGGSHERYKTDGVFDLSKWRARQNTYDTPAIKAAVAAAVADGTIIGASVMDEPHNTTEHAGWGGNITKPMVDGMCGFVKNIFPTLPVGVVHDYRHFEPEKNYQTCEFVATQYRMSKGDVREYRDGGLAFARRSGISIIFSLNVLHGGAPGTTCDKWGFDANGRLCPMTANQIVEWGKVLGPAGCTLNMWRYEQAYFDRPENQQAFKELAAHLATLPAKSCGKP